MGEPDHTSDLAQIGRLLEVMDSLLAPGGCEWDRAQNHRSLTQYCLEEAYEVVEAIETEDRVGLREELGDLLLQVVFHSAIAAGEDDAFSVGDVAAGIADKLIRRHPDVTSLGRFRCGAGEADATDEWIERTAVGGKGDARDVAWDKMKTLEKGRTSVLEGIPRAQPALARAEKIVGRARRAGLDLAEIVCRASEDRPSDSASAVSGDSNEESRGDGIGARLLAVVIDADAAGVDAEGALRARIHDLEKAVVHSENC